MYQIKETAYKLDLTNIEEPWCCNNDIVYYGSRGFAKRMACIDNDCAKTIFGEPISFLNVKVKRFPERDKIFLTSKKVVKRYELEQNKRLERIKQLPKDKYYYVQDKRNYVGNAVLWWAKDSQGYVTDLSKAHKYSYNEISKFNPRETDIIWESEHVENAIRQYVDAQYLNMEHSI